MDTFRVGLLLSTFIEAMAVQAEIEAMKTANQERVSHGESLAYGEESFQGKAKHLWACSNQARMQVS